MNNHYLKYKETINRGRKAWILRQDKDEYKKIICDLVADHYIRNKEKILLRKHNYYFFKKEVNRLFSTYDIYEK